VVAAPAAQHPVTETGDPGPSGRGPQHRRTIATVLAAVTVLALAGVVVLLTWLRGETSEIDAAQQDRLEVTQATERFVESWNTFTPENAEQYVEDIAPLLSTKFRTEFTDSAEDVLTGIEQQQLSSEGEVLVDTDGIPLVGIATLDQDSAEVLVVSDADRESSGQQVVRHWRWQVSLVQVDGEWLVDAFKEV
jgi:Mce-associated membrane protein